MKHTETMLPVTPARTTRQSRPRQLHCSWCCASARRRINGRRPLCTIGALGEGISRDPIGEMGGRNLHHFNYNDAVGHIDSDGKQSWPTGAFPIPCPPGGPGIPDPRPPGWPPNIPYPPPPKNPPSLVGEKSCPSQVANAIQLANAAMGKGKCKQWFIDHGADGQKYAVFCHGKCKLVCLFGGIMWTAPVLPVIGVCKDNLSGYSDLELASLLIHEAGHHFVTIGPGREEGASQAQDACADALTGQE